MEKFKVRFQDKPVIERRMGPFQDRINPDETGQAVELRDRFGITNPKLLAKALRISEIKAMDIVNDWDSIFTQEK
jgi:hypothetical protein